MTDNFNPHTTGSLASAMYMTTCNLTEGKGHNKEYQAQMAAPVKERVLLQTQVKIHVYHNYLIV
jgi:hypothetical protein